MTEHRPDPPRIRDALRVSVLVLGAVLLHRVGRGPLGGPPAGAVVTWLESTHPVDVAAAMVRTAAEIATWYVVALSVVQLVAAAAGCRGVADRASRALPAPLRHLVTSSVGITFALGAVTAGSSPAGAGVREPAEIPTATMRPIRADAVVTDAPRVPDVLPATPTGTSPPVPAPTPATTWEVSPGESFWTIASEALAEAWGREPGPAEVAPYWRALVDANRPRLLDPDDVDLVVSGQVLELPTPPAAPLA